MELLDITSWKTTLTGLAAIVGGIGLLINIAIKFADGEAVNAEQVVTALAAISTGIGLIAARDNSKTSEDVGAK